MNNRRNSQVPNVYATNRTYSYRNGGEPEFKTRTLKRNERGELVETIDDTPYEMENMGYPPMPYGMPFFGVPPHLNFGYPSAPPSFIDFPEFPVMPFMNNFPPTYFWGPRDFQNFQQSMNGCPIHTKKHKSKKNHRKHDHRSEKSDKSEKSEDKLDKHKHEKKHGN